MSLNSLQSSGEIYIHKLIPTVDGGFIAAGRFNGRVDVDSGPEEKIYNSDLTDVFVVKYSDELELLWSFTSDLNDSNDNTLLDAYMDGDGYLYSSGLYSRPQSGLGTVMIVNKMDTLGNELWTYEVEAEGYNHFTSIDVYDGHIYVSGNFTGMADFDSDPDSELIYQSESSSNVICKLDTDGNLLWAKKIDGVAYGHHLELSTVGEIFVGGFFRDTVDFDPGVEEQFVVVDDYSPFMIKLDSDGILKWVWTKPENGSVQKLIRDEYSISLPICLMIIQVIALLQNWHTRMIRFILELITLMGFSICLLDKPFLNHHLILTMQLPSIQYNCRILTTS